MLSDFIYQFFCCPLGLAADASLTNALVFFIGTTLKISLLLVLVVSLMGIVNAYLPVEWVKKNLTDRNWWGLEHLLAAIFGAITPFCSCSSVPLFIGFLKGGIPLGVTLSFLITSPLVNEVAIVLFWGVFGIKITLIYVGFGLMIGTLVGWLLGHLNLQPYLADWVKESLEKRSENAPLPQDDRSFRLRWPEIRRDAKQTFHRIFPYVLGGIFVGALIHGFVPPGYFELIMKQQQWLSVPLATIIAVPLYSNAAGVIPVVQSLVDKGVPLGTALAFMMSVVGLSFPEAILLKKVMHLKLLILYFFSVSCSIILFGYLVNFWG